MNQFTSLLAPWRPQATPSSCLTNADLLNETLGTQDRSDQQLLAIPYQNQTDEIVFDVMAKLISMSSF